MNVRKPATYGLYQHGKQIATFEGVPNAVKIQELIAATEQIDTTAQIELRMIGAAEGLSSSTAKNNTAVWNTTDGTMPPWMKWLFGDNNNNQVPDPLEGLLDGLFSFDTAPKTTQDVPKPTPSQASPKYTSNQPMQQQIPPTVRAHKNPSPDASRSAQSNIVRILLLLIGLGVLARIFLF